MSHDATPVNTYYDMSNIVAVTKKYHYFYNEFQKKKNCLRHLSIDFSMNESVATVTTIVSDRLH